MLSAFGFFTTEAEIKEIFDLELDEYIEKLTYSDLDVYVLKDKIFVYEEGKEIMSEEYLVIDFEKQMEDLQEVSEELFEVATQFDKPVKFIVLLMPEEEIEVEEASKMESKVSKLNSLFDQLETSDNEDDDSPSDSKLVKAS
ncbi:MAG: hypothetical protein Solivirus2_49 [Solivirus sp.]|uniref:Uncharacterized protein n=1 Tax=Solivirus sp. TaxID=2487772 RepID=A0A3G5AFR5_9VIRU|nr:MAG: hypothetical protein Solivirus2_49 [Solivirus sp.]